MTTQPSRKQTAHQWGLDAEAKAAAFLRGKGYRILAERLRTAGGEIDVLALADAETLVIVEVKARQKLDDGLYAITPAKCKRLARAAEAVLMESDKIAGLHNAAALNIRFDAIIITPDAAPEHLANAWQVE